MKLKSIIYLAVGLNLELISVYFLFSPYSSSQRVLDFILVHACAALCAALALRWLVPKRLRHTPWRAMLFLYSISFFIPLVGILGLMLFTLPALHKSGARGPRVPWSITDIPELPAQPFKVSAQPIYIAVGLAGVLRHSDDDAQRLHAVMATRQMPNRQAIPILNIALKDTADDVRLLAYSMLDGKEREISTRIKEISEDLSRAGTNERSDIQRRLAQQYWELAYLGLAQGEVLTHVLSEAEKYLRRSFKREPNNTGAHRLLGRVLMHQGRDGDAREAFARALELGLPQDVVSPYLAELAFRAHRFGEVRQHLKSISAMARERSPLAELTAWWLSPESESHL